MANDIQQVTLDGQGLQIPDMNVPFRQAALAGDEVLAELLRLPPTSGTSVAKGILPYAVQGSNVPLVAPNGASGAVYIQPFRVVVGPRTVPSATPGSALLAWNDVRSRVYAVTADDINLGLSQPFTPNSSGNPRWDIVYAAIAVDQDSADVTRNIRAPGSAPTDAPVPESVVPSLTQVVSVAVQPGTPAANPVFPALPADTVTATGTFYVPLAAVLIPDGFGSTTIVLSEWICMLAPVLPTTTALGGIDSRPPNMLAAGLPSALIQTWGASKVRPSQALPCTRQGGARRRFGFDATTSVPILTSGAVIDNSIDWRNRTFLVRGSYKVGATQFAWQPGATAGAIPLAAGMTTFVQESQSFVGDATLVTGIPSSPSAAVVFLASNANVPSIPADGSAVGFYVDLTTGHLSVYYQGTPGLLLIVTIDADAPFDNV